MSIHRRITAVIIIILGTMVCVALFFPKENEPDDKKYALRVGAGDDASGFLLERVSAISKASGSGVSIDSMEEDFEAYKFKDC